MAPWCATAPTPGASRTPPSAALQWLDSFGADGLRLDFVPGPSHAFWIDFQRGIKQHYPGALTLGEITDTPEAFATYAGRLDSTSSWTFLSWEEGFQDRHLLEHYRRIIALRHAHLALRSGHFTPLAPHLDGDATASREQVGAYLRHQGDDRLLVALNNTQQRVALTIPLTDIRSALGDTSTIELIPHMAYATTPPSTLSLRDAAIHLDLPPLVAAIVTLRAPPHHRIVVEGALDPNLAH